MEPIYKQIKVYSVEVTRFPNVGRTSKKWYYQHKGELFYCILILKQTEDSNTLSPQFLVIEKQGEEFKAPVLVRTIRPIDCSVVFEQIIEHKILYDLALVFANKNGLEKLYPSVQTILTQLNKAV
jgi:hypothetical protein